MQAHAQLQLHRQAQLQVQEQVQLQDPSDTFVMVSVPPAKWRVSLFITFLACLAADFASGDWLVQARIESTFARLTSENAAPAFAVVRPNLLRNLRLSIDASRVDVFVIFGLR